MNIDTVSFFFILPLVIIVNIAIVLLAMFFITRLIKKMQTSA
jgi:hypothetical protein